MLSCIYTNILTYDMFVLVLFQSGTSSVCPCHAGRAEAEDDERGQHRTTLSTAPALAVISRDATTNYGRLREHGGNERLQER